MSTWSGRRAFVTGHTGFKGSWLCRWLLRSGCTVAGYALPPPEGRPSLFVDLRLDDHVASTLGDVRDADAVKSAMRAFRPDVVFHLAAQPIVRISYREPAHTLETNIMGTVRVLEAVRATPDVRAVVVVTSDKCYDERHFGRGYREDDPLGGPDPYSASKAGEEVVAAAYRASFFGAGPLLATVRAGNVIGGGDWSVDRLIPDVMAAILADRPIVLRYPGAVRPWQHVLEPLNAYRVVAEHLLAGETSIASAYNVGPVDADHRTVREVVERLYAGWGKPSAVETTDEPQPAEADLLKLDAAKIARELGVVPRLGLDRACEMTAVWYRERANGTDAALLCDADITRFESAVPAGAR